MRDTNKYYYVEVALPKDNAAIQQMVAKSDRQGVPLRVLIRQACVDMYSDEGYTPNKPVEKGRGPRNTGSGTSSASQASKNAADDFLNDNGF